MIPTPAPSATARACAVRRIARRARQFPDLDFDPIDTSGLDGRDAALAAAIDHAVTRRWLTLVAVLESCLTRPWDRVEPDLQAVLLAGAAQLLFFDRIPEHAAISASVDLAKELVRPGAAGFVNAVLRKLAGLRTEVLPHDEPASAKVIPRGDGRAWRLARDVLDRDRVRGLAERYSHGTALVAHWIATFGDEIAERLARHGLVVPPIIVAGATDDTGLVAHAEPGFHVVEGDLDDLLQRQRGVRVQDPTAARPVAATTDVSPACIIDLCAGRGTKTVQLAATHPEARIIATDTDKGRFAELSAAFADHPRVDVVPFERIREHDGRADLLVLDVPCSNSGVLARRVEARYRFSAASLQALTDLQRQIVADAMPLLAETGRVLYTTCSVEPAENTRQAEWACKWHRFRIEREEEVEPAGEPGESPTTYHDGGYWALLTRVHVVG